MERRAFVYQGLKAVTFAFAAPAVGFAEKAVAAALKEPEIEALTKSIAGKIYRPGAAEYEALRHGFAAKVDEHPALIAHAASAQDVAKAVDFARVHKLPLAVRGGGHSYAGYNVCEGGVVIDLSGLQDVAISEDLTSARVGGGTLSGKLELATAKVGRAAVLGQCPGVGVGGFSLGGGVGPLMSKYGLGCDNILSADVVLANGKMVVASEKQNPDLYWAIRGGGGNFGVVTAFTIALHPVSEVLAGYMSFRADTLAELLHVLREMAALATDELTLIATCGPSKGGKFSLSVQACYHGDAAKGEELLASVRKSKLLVRDTVHVLPYIELEQEVPAHIPPMLAEGRGGFFPEMNDAIVGAMSELAATTPGIWQFTFLHLHGKPTQMKRDATAFPMRTPGFAWGVASIWTKPAEQEAAAKWVESVAMRLAPFGGGAYVNVMDREGEASVRRAYGENYARLAKLKAKYDPANLFSINQNIRPRG